MKTTCIQNNLSDALAIAVVSRATLPVTQNVLISTEPDRLRVSSTNLEIAITTSIPASIEEEGAATITPRHSVPSYCRFPRLCRLKCVKSS